MTWTLQSAIFVNIVIMTMKTLLVSTIDYPISIITQTMMTSSNGNIFRVTGHLCGVNSPHKGQWRGALMFSLICGRINVWVNNGEAGDLRRHRAHYYVTVMEWYLMVLNSKMLVKYSLLSVSILSIIFHTVYGTVCIQHTHLPYYDCENACALSYLILSYLILSYHHYHHHHNHHHHYNQIISRNRLLLFRVGPWNNAVDILKP